MAENSKALEDRFKKLLAVTKECAVVLPLKEVVVAGNRVAVDYRLNITRIDGTKYTDHIVTIITLKNDRILTWNAVAAHQG